MFPTGSPSRLSSASAYCQYASTHMMTGTTAFPAQATQACGQDPARYSSACSCDPKRSTVSTTSTTPSSTLPTASPTACLTDSLLFSAGANVKDGDIECGLLPWVAASVVGTTTQITRPGKASNFAFEVDQIISPDTSTGGEQASLTQNVATRAGAMYSLNIDTNFNSVDAGSVGVKIDGVSLSTFNARDFVSDQWTSHTVFFQQQTTMFNIKIEIFPARQGAVIKVDNIYLVGGQKR